MSLKADENYKRKLTAIFSVDIKDYIRIETNNDLTIVPGRDKLSPKWSFKIEPPILGKNG